MQLASWNKRYTASVNAATYSGRQLQPIVVVTLLWLSNVTMGRSRGKALASVYNRPHPQMTTDLIDAWCCATGLTWFKPHVFSNRTASSAWRKFGDAGKICQEPFIPQIMKNERSIYFFCRMVSLKILTASYQLSLARVTSSAILPEHAFFVVGTSLNGVWFSPKLLSNINGAVETSGQLHSWLVYIFTKVFYFFLQVHFA